MKNAVLIAGPTASGKSALALDIARRSGGTVVNADSMQVYAVLRVLTARPGDADLAAAPHRLYGHRSPAEPYSTGAWAREVEELALSGAFGQGPPIFVGGTGLYFRALLEGLSRMPEIPAEVREKWRGALEEEGAGALHRVLAESDPETAAALAPSDGQRIARALEVLEASGRSIRDWRGVGRRPTVDAASARLIVIEPDRTELARRIDQRFEAMIGNGALDEARALAALDLDPSLPAMKAIGVRELLAADAGSIPLREAIERAKAATRQYAKRQSTWFRNQFGAEWARIASRDEARAIR